MALTDFYAKTLNQNVTLWGFKELSLPQTIY